MNLKQQMQVLLCIPDEINNEDQRIFRLDERAEARRCRELPRLDPRRLRFFPSCVRAEGYRVRFNTEVSDVSIAILLTLAMRPVGAFLFGRAAPSCADGERPSLLFARICVRLLAPLDRAHRPARAVRNCDGWRMGAGGAAQVPDGRLGTGCAAARDRGAGRRCRYRTAPAACRCSQWLE